MYFQFCLIITTAGQRNAEVKQAQQEIQEAETLLKQMTLTARNVPNNANLLQKIKNYEADIQKLKLNLKKSETQMNRDELLAGGITVC